MIKPRKNIKKHEQQKILHDEPIFFYKDDLVLAHMGANSFKLVFGWALIRDGRLIETGAN